MLLAVWRSDWATVHRLSREAQFPPTCRVGGGSRSAHRPPPFASLARSVAVQGGGHRGRQVSGRSRSEREEEKEEEEEEEKEEEEERHGRREAVHGGGGDGSGNARCLIGAHHERNAARCARKGEEGRQCPARSKRGGRVVSGQKSV
ncbi:hypothetical protein CBR_g8728 [Chara braunii]|uniref:Uncharacterized protein n=1 Tax=Chara braunii TaxID=69332 RepID=A0A388KML8_CHABU|nr:hypothetical protein CBR_g8728 [Chara braunii]|eukprot:GBG71306.1 hypothetical protein CBR_g8728 [Chara braunii]